MLKTACGNGFPLNIPSVIPESGGSGGTSDYSELSNKPKINNVTLSGDKSAADLGLASADIEDLIPADASSSNQLATAADLPGLATTSAAGLVQPDGTSIIIEDGVISAVGGSGSGEIYSTSETVIGTWFGETLYRKCITVNTLPNAGSIDILHGITNAKIVKCYGMARTKNNVLPNGTYYTFPYSSSTASTVCVVLGKNLQITTTVDRSGYEGVVILEYTKVS